MTRLLRSVLQVTVGLTAALALTAISDRLAHAQAVQGTYLAAGAQANAAIPFFGAGSKAQADGAWDYYQKSIGQPMSEWAKTEIRRPPGGTVFYPFSGRPFCDGCDAGGWRAC